MGTAVRKKLIIGNWKMNLSVGQAGLLAHRLSKRIKGHRNVEVVLAPNLLALQPVSLGIDRRKFHLAAQNAHYKDEGAYTGEVSFTMLRGLVQYCLVGHSERRLYFDETLDVVREKVAAAVRNDIVPVLCVGETHAERVAGETKQVLHDQMATALQQLSSDEVGDIVVAYEPVWAISTFGGGVAKPADIEDAVKYIRFQIEELYGKAVARQVRVLYGGSVNDHNAGAYLEVPGIDGLLVGGASLNYHSFSAIVERASRMVHSS